MKMSITRETLITYVNRQLLNFFPDEHQHLAEIEAIVDKALARLSFCFLDILK